MRFFNIIAITVKEGLYAKDFIRSKKPCIRAKAAPFYNRDFYAFCGVYFKNTQNRVPTIRFVMRNFGVCDKLFK